MSDRIEDEWWDSADTTQQSLQAPDGVENVEAYEVDDGVVFYDAQNPLAWMETTMAVTLREQA
ncbi:DUF7331 family protein [Haloprofundus salilacus]|uniref:DUF7331 family protein n=1 Tax=Haloprofundus salilacus TaxID=2876190 RepID=UPI001CCA133A|nr:hypothetical protein [Haloprofundus salilacus]